MSDKIRDILENLFMVEDTARLDYIKDKIVKHTEEIILMVSPFGHLYQGGYGSTK